MQLCKILLLAALAASNVVGAQTLPRPKLVVGIMVDQMRWDYLYRYYDRYGKTGFKRLLQEGFSCENTMINYVPSVTAVGHASVYTGSIPAVHGIIGNDWYERKLQKNVYCVYDSTEASVGRNVDGKGSMSPRHMLSTTVGDELRMGTGFKSRVVGIALKDRAAVLPAGHSANAAFWFDHASGNFISSTYYMDSLPRWAVDFNNEKRPAKYIQQDWQTLYPINTYTASTADNKYYEVTIDGEEKPVFKHTFTKGKDYDNLTYSPLGNTLTFDFAKAAITGYELGKTATDLLAVSFSTPDIAGHSFGPNAIEMEDMYLRLDIELGHFLTWLDNRYGKGNYLVFLTADHGAINSPGFLQENKLPALPEKLSKIAVLNESIRQTFGIEKAILSDAGGQLYMDTAAINRSGVSYDKVEQLMVGKLRSFAGIADAVNIEKIQAGYLPQPFNAMFINGWHAKRGGDIFVVPGPGVKNGSMMGTTHGTMYPYDTHIPLLWFGWNITPGKSYKTTNITDIAPTLSALLHIQMPSGTTGQVIEEVMKK
ncbi:type I phosphodiesterase/nucleotide pyrophosphatase [Chitinophaga skermanii]|uniref:Type I phosphodiesterase/nucleotide pyrophosphatase n=1 Tax=Chitinophaga skermanii TaxID=331697 RepID=A0A327QQ16_9BACT|nr:alkaline phosphatase PafA [Chitinophaga skermanii]RAJ05443.1 type I phosphodiesterase/nucleotide pyrophosphatase [Chitinophaga skermanii]